MSITNEVERINSAKNDLKSELLSRGADVENITIDMFAEKLKELMYCVKGEWTPEEDVFDISVDGFCFCPEVVVLFNREMHNLSINEAVSLVVLIKDSTGVVRYRKSDGQIGLANVAPTSSIVSWKDSGYEVNMPQTSGCFKTGYAYEYYVLGRAQ